MYTAAGLMVFWLYIIVFLMFDDCTGAPTKAPSYMTAAIIVAVLIL